VKSGWKSTPSQAGHCDFISIKAPLPDEIYEKCRK